MDDPNMHAYEDQYMDTTDLILRSVCETDPADPDLKDTVCIGISDLKAILDLHLLATSKPETKPAQQDAVDADSLAEFFALHAAELEDNPYAYCEVAYTRATGWMAWITDKPLCAVVVAPDRKVLTSGQGDTPAEAARAAISAKKGG